MSEVTRNAMTVVEKRVISDEGSPDRLIRRCASSWPSAEEMGLTISDFHFFIGEVA